jgi:hypothetical protein
MSVCAVICWLLQRIALNFSECISDYYGQLCDQPCSSNCVNGSCFSNNGTCVDGCIGEFSDDKCTQGKVLDLLLLTYTINIQGGIRCLGGLSILC